ncbi:MAG TPA: DUF2550 domain-containing protein [Dermatophilaceae bacterium]|nr:DUF2550 domain-containing protein [Dermatophilaceae bacterium]
MRDLLATGELLLVILVLGLVTALVAIYVRRRTISKGQPLIVCAMRRTENPRWRYGLVRTGATSLQWFTLFGLSPRPRYTWDRSRLNIGSPLPLAAGSAPETLVPNGVMVRCAYDDSAFDLAVSAAPYTALRSWLEASPPGGHIDVE